MTASQAQVSNSQPGVRSIYNHIIAGSCTLEPLVCGIWNPKGLTSKGFIIPFAAMKYSLIAAIITGLIASSLAQLFKG